jgi:BirA family biotin operon repressor/biotin-[acetyl-CoA-carboxylase] ligase
MSLVLRDVPGLLPLAAAVAVCDVAGARARIKWPNDIVFERRSERSCGRPELGKLAGILIEGRPQEGWVVLGIGLNVAVSLQDVPAELKGTVASMGEERRAIEPNLQRLLSALEVRLHQPAEATLEAWRKRDVLWGHEIAWTQRPSESGPAGRASCGSAQGIDGAGRLVVRRRDGRRATLEAGEVHLIAPECSRTNAGRH